MSHDSSPIRFVVALGIVVTVFNENHTDVELGKDRRVRSAVRSLRHVEAHIAMRWQRI